MKTGMKPPAELPYLYGQRVLPDGHYYGVGSEWGNMKQNGRDTLARA